MPRKNVINRTVKLNRFTGDGQAFVRVGKTKIKAIPVWFDVYSTYPLPRLDVSARIKFKDLIKAQLETGMFPKNSADDETLIKGVCRSGHYEVLDVTIEKLDEPAQREMRIVLDIEKYLSNQITSQNFIKSEFVDENEIENLNN